MLFLAYEFPPSAGGGVQRLTKFARYLPEHGWTPVVVTGTPVPGRPYDETLCKEVERTITVRLPARHVGAMVAGVIRPFKRLLRRGPGAPAPAGGASAVGGSTARRRLPLSTRVSRWLAVPDDAVLWCRAAEREALRLAAEHRPAAVFASGPPHSVLVAGARVARRLGVPFVADVRDAWRDNPDLYAPTPWHRHRSRSLEREVMRAAAAVLAVSAPIAAEAREMGARTVEVVPNGFDGSELPGWEPDPRAPLTIAFMGRFYASLDPTTFFKGLAIALGRGEVDDVRVRIVGPDAPQARATVASLGLDARVEFGGYRPHAEAVALVAGADAALVTITDRPGGEANYTGKLFEYLGIGVPVLLVGPPHGVAAALVAEAHAGVVAPWSEPERIADVIEDLWRAKREGRRPQTADRSVVARFDRRAQAGRLAALLDAGTEVAR